MLLADRHPLDDFLSLRCDPASDDGPARLREARRFASGAEILDRGRGSALSREFARRSIGLREIGGERRDTAERQGQETAEDRRPTARSDGQERVCSHGTSPER
ncbi:hypothetical protein ASF32_05165 [Methylobacterium sp. Leaf91]|nr:hypothetical protein ASF24_21350 [Methylobacterium sp. Leaf86]KQO90363.1 hypothetical protein ASF32_05165 [Methylobacterium sp. Leaf91]